MSKLSQAQSKLHRKNIDIISGFQGTVGYTKKSGGDGTVVTPVPIPNTEVKHRSGEGSRAIDKNSALPGFFFYGPFWVFFRL